MAARTLLLVAALATAGIATPLESRQNCGAVWTQCGGQGWSGSSCCASGSTCSIINEWYHQCIPGAAVPSSSSSSSSSRSSTSPTSTRVSTSSSTSVATSTTGGVTRTSSTSAGVTQPPASGTATWAGNPFSGVNQWANSYYASEILNLAVPSLSGAQATAAAKVAEVPTFMWLDTFSKTPLMRSTLADIRKANAAGGNYAGQFVVYDLPDRDCAAAASNGEYAIDNGGVEKYKTYIDTIREIIITYSDIRILLAIEPDSLANMVTNMGVAKCAKAAPYYHDLTQYAIKQLNLPNVAMYLDAGHAGWLGYPDNSVKAAQMFAEVYKEAGRPKALRGLVTNVSNYNAWSLTSPPPYVDGAPTYDEKKFVNLIGPLLVAQGWTDVKFIVDQGRSGKQPTGQTAWGHWCNAIGTGFGPRPSTNTGDALVDAFVWVKPGGECDGTSDTTAARYDLNCGREDALKPAPEAGTWFQAYFVQLLNNASPAF